MKVIILHYRESYASLSPWVYIGSDVLRFQKCEQKFKGKLITLKGKIESLKESERDSYLGWIKLQAGLNKNSLHWNFNHLATRNNLVSTFYLSYIQILALCRWTAESKKDTKELIVVCEDAYLAKSVY